jgi:hypothetical protein
MEGANKTDAQDSKDDELQFPSLEQIDSTVSDATKKKKFGSFQTMGVSRILVSVLA